MEKGTSECEYHLHYSRCSTENIDLLRKTSLSIFQEDLLNELFAELKTDDMKQFNLPELRTKIESPAVIVIPIAIYA